MRQVQGERWAPRTRAFGLEAYDSWLLVREQLQWRRCCEESGVPPVEAALSLGGSELSAGERHGLENFFVLEGRLYVRALRFCDCAVGKVAIV
jgi:hypothetical protein